LLLKDVQSAALKAPLFAADAVGIFKVITGVVVPVATVELTSIPVVPSVKAATEVTVPPEPAAVNVPPLSVKPLPTEITSGFPVKAELRPNNEFVAIVAIFVKATELFGIVVAFPTDVTSPVKLAFVVTFPAVKPDAVPVILVPTKAEGVPRLGVISVGEDAKTAEPEPVLSVNAVDKFAEENEPNEVAFPEDVTAPFKLALVTTVVFVPELVTIPVRFGIVASLPLSF